MIKYVKSITLFLTLGLMGSAFAAADGEASQNLFGLKEQDPIVQSQVKFLSNVDLAFTSLSGGSSKVTFGAGVDADWMFTPNVGAFVGIDYNPIRAKDQGFDLEVNYIDIPFGVAFDFLSGSSLSVGSQISDFSSIMNVGLYAGIPLSKFKVDGTSVDSANTVIGLNLEGHSNYQFTKSFGLGFHAGIKYGFTKVVDNTADDYKPFTLSVGLSAKFL